MAKWLIKLTLRLSAAGLTVPLCGVVYAQEQRAPQVPLTAAFTLNATVETGDDRIYLGKVATCAGAPEICEEASEVDLGAAPEAGRSVFLARTKLQAMLATEWDGATIEVRGVDQVKVSSGFVDVDEAGIRSRLTDELKEAFPEDGKFAVTVDKLMLSGKPRLRPGDYTIEFPTLAGLKERSRDWLVRNMIGSHGLPVRLSSAGGGTGGVNNDTVSVSVSFTLSERLPVTRRAMEAGDVLGSEDFEESWVVVGRGHQPFADRVATLVGKRLKRPVAVGAPVQVNQLEVPSIVRKGELVTMHMNGEGVNVTGQVKVLDDGGYGEAVEVLMISTKKRLRARVVDASTVEYLR